MKIKLNIANDVNEFAQICRRSFRENIEVRQGRYVVNGKSVMGLFSLNLLNPVEVFIDTDDEYTIYRFKEMIKDWITEE